VSSAGINEFPFQVWRYYQRIDYGQQIFFATPVVKPFASEGTSRQYSNYQTLRANPATDIQPVADKEFLRWFV
jgi:hypothetical protein